jgi:hypothetical protein
MFGPNVSLLTAGHPTDPVVRSVCLLPTVALLAHTIYISVHLPVQYHTPSYICDVVSTVYSALSLQHTLCGSVLQYIATALSDIRIRRVSSHTLLAYDQYSISLGASVMLDKGPLAHSTGDPRLMLTHSPARCQLLGRRMQSLVLHTNRASLTTQPSVAPHPCVYSVGAK